MSAESWKLRDPYHPRGTLASDKTSHWTQRTDVSGPRVVIRSIGTHSQERLAAPSRARALAWLLVVERIADPTTNGRQRSTQEQCLRAKPLKHLRTRSLRQ